MIVVGVEGGVSAVVGGAVVEIACTVVAVVGADDGALEGSAALMAESSELQALNTNVATQSTASRRMVGNGRCMARR